MSVSPQVRPPVVTGATSDPRDSPKRRREDSFERDPAVRARQITAAFANAERLRYTEGHQRTMVESIRARHKAKGRKRGKDNYEEVMKECRVTTLFSMFSRSKRDGKAVNVMVEMLMHLNSQALLAHMLERGYASSSGVRKRTRRVPCRRSLKR